MSTIIASGGGEIAILLFSDQKAEDQVIQASHAMRSIRFGKASAIFMKRDIPAVMQSILDAPIRADQSEQFLRSDFFSGETGATIHDLMLDFTSLGGNELPL